MRIMIYGPKIEETYRQYLDGLKNNIKEIDGHPFELTHHNEIGLEASLIIEKKGTTKSISLKRNYQEYVDSLIGNMTKVGDQVDFSTPIMQFVGADKLEYYAKSGNKWYRCGVKAAKGIMPTIDFEEASSDLAGAMDTFEKFAQMAFKIRDQKYRQLGEKYY
jgi:hypothetical protein